MFGSGSLVYQFVIGLRHPRRFHIAQAPGSSYTLLSLFAYATVLLTLSFAVFTLAVFTGTKLLNPGGYPDPFLQFQNIHLRQPLTIESQHSCDSAENDYVYETGRIIEADTKNFSRVLVICQVGIVAEVQFFAHELQVVDLVLKWGPPNQIQQSAQHYILRWESGLVAYAATGRRFHFQLPVGMVLLKPSDY